MGSISFEKHLPGNNYMNRIILLFYILFSLTGCSKEKQLEEYPVIDIVNNAGKYQRVYCSDYFSSIELIPLETRSDCLLDFRFLYDILIKDNIIFLQGEGRLYAFDGSGKFRNKIGEKGQGVGEYQYLSDFFANTDRPTIYIADYTRISEYDFSGTFIRAFKVPKIDDISFFGFSYAGDDLFIGHSVYNGKNKYKYGLFDRNGEMVQAFPGYFLFERDFAWSGLYDFALDPIRVDNRLYLKDYVNDTIYQLANSNLQPAYVFGLGQYIFPIEYLETFHRPNPIPNHAFIIRSLVGMPNFFFYQFYFPDSFSTPKSKPVYNPILKENRSYDGLVYGLYDIEQQTNILLDTDQHLQKGMINDMNGGLSFIPRYYAGDGIVVDVWNVEEMKDMLTDEYFASQKIKDAQAHQKLKEILRNLKDDDNPVLVMARLKE